MYLEIGAYHLFSIIKSPSPVYCEYFLTNLCLYAKNIMSLYNKIKDNLGGIILDYRNRSVEFDKVFSNVNSHMKEM